MKIQKCSVKRFWSNISSFGFGNASRVSYFCCCLLRLIFQFSSHGSTRLKPHLCSRALIQFKALCVFLNDFFSILMNQHLTKKSQHFMENFFFFFPLVGKKSAPFKTRFSHPLYGRIGERNLLLPF